MDPYSFFLYLRTEEFYKIQEFVLSNKEKIKPLFAGEEHYQRFLEMIQDHSENLLCKRINTYSYILFIFDAAAFYEVFVIIYDPDIKRLYCDSFVSGTDLDIKGDMDVLRRLYLVSDPLMIRVQGDLYVNIVRISYFKDILDFLNMRALVGDLEEILTLARSIYDAMIYYLSGKTDIALKYPMLCDLISKKEVQKLSNNLLDKVSRFFDDRGIKDHAEAISQILHHLYDKIISLSKILREDFNIKEPYYVVKGLFNKSYMIINLKIYLCKLYINLYSDMLDYRYLLKVIKAVQALKKINDIRIQELFMKILECLDAIVYHTRIIRERILEKPINKKLMDYLLKQVSLINLNISRPNGGNPHKVYFVGINFFTEYLAFSDIIVEHPEHGIRIIPINGYNPRYIDVEQWKRAEKEDIFNIPVAVVRFFLA